MSSGTNLPLLICEYLFNGVVVDWNWLVMYGYFTCHMFNSNFRRNLFFHKFQFMSYVSLQVECRVCNDVFSLQGDKVPRLLHCGHTVCHQCLTRLQLHGRALLCPFDRQPTEVGDSGVWGLKKNFALIELLEKLTYSCTKPLLQWNTNTLEKEKEVCK